jgi:hypothetical protein
MSEHQTLIYIITFVFIGIAVFIGLIFYDQHQVSSNKDVIINTMNIIAEDVIHYRYRPVAMGGGGGAADHYSLPRSLAVNEDGSFAIAFKPSGMMIVGTSSKGYGQVTAEMSRDGELSNFSYSGQFK